AVVDHQIAHVYVKSRVDEVRALLEKMPGIEIADKRSLGLDHARSGELVVLAAPDKWFSYYYWLDDARAPDYARTVDIHRKAGNTSFVARSRHDAASPRTRRPT